MAAVHELSRTDARRIAVRAQLSAPAGYAAGAGDAHDTAPHTGNGATAEREALSAYLRG